MLCSEKVNALTCIDNSLSGHFLSTSASTVLINPIRLEPVFLWYQTKLNGRLRYNTDTSVEVSASGNAGQMDCGVLNEFVRERLFVE